MGFSLSSCSSCLSRFKWVYLLEKRIDSGYSLVYFGTMMKLLLIMLLLLTVTAGTGFCANSSSNFGGVGIDGVPRADGTIVVRQLVEGGPAQVAGVKTGDIITQIDGTSTFGSDFNDMVQRHLRGRAGTPVVLRVKRPGNPKPLSFRMIRRQLTLPPARKKQ